VLGLLAVCSLKLLFHACDCGASLCVVCRDSEGQWMMGEALLISPVSVAMPESPWNSAY